VLEEVYRVFRPAGILEIIEDELLWSYLQSLPTSPVGSIFPYKDDIDAVKATNTRHTTSTKRKISTIRNTGLNAYGEYDSNVALSRSMEVFEKMVWLSYAVHPPSSQIHIGPHNRCL
jgi:hypothetical protein